METQKKKILHHLKHVGGLTAMQALRLFGCFRLAARISELTKSGYTVNSKFVTVGPDLKRVKYYWMRLAG